MTEWFDSGEGELSNSQKSRNSFRPFSLRLGEFWMGFSKNSHFFESGLKKNQPNRFTGCVFSKKFSVKERCVVLKEDVRCSKGGIVFSGLN